MFGSNDPYAKGEWRNFLSGISQTEAYAKYSAPSVYKLESIYRLFLDETNPSKKEAIGKLLHDECEYLKLKEPQMKPYLEELLTSVDKSKTNRFFLGIVKTVEILSPFDKEKALFKNLMSHVKGNTSEEALTSFSSNLKTQVDLKLLFQKNPLPTFVRQEDLFTILKNDAFKESILTQLKKSIQAPHIYPTANGFGLIMDRLINGDGSKQAKEMGREIVGVLLKELSILSKEDKKVLSDMINKTSEARPRTNSQTSMVARLSTSQTAKHLTVLNVSSKQDEKSDITLERPATPKSKVNEARLRKSSEPEPLSEESSALSDDEKSVDEKSKNPDLSLFETSRSTGLRGSRGNF